MIIMGCNILIQAGIDIEKNPISSSSESFVRKNEKFFIKPEDVMLVKLMIVRHMPLDIFGRKVRE